MSESYAAEDKGPNIILTVCVIVGISTLFVAARLFVRIKILGQTHLDDHLTVLSLIQILTNTVQLLSYLTVGLEIWAIRCGNGRHADTLSQEQQSAAVLSTISDDSADLVVWTVVEGNTLIIAACIPILGPLVELALGRRVLSTTDRKYQEQSGTAELQPVSTGGKAPRSIPWNGDSVGRTSTVINSYHEGKDASSQESILEATFRQKKGVVGILRRDDITIFYETDDGPKNPVGIDKPAKGNPL
ncbi:hypothetical protein CSHISOI_06041 [Colletotrichum shisoi]|uniref:Integral membrane protein n=1 Tax=Colletotrichum shisoi TaxID=2078593 RepID=A0A5Q4BR56_9PEZI|nr:hypothetical protein CSHISOI_06041 [Colletotrichum shisoi]